MADSFEVMSLSALLAKKSILDQRIAQERASLIDQYLVNVRKEKVAGKLNAAQLTLLEQAEHQVSRIHRDNELVLEMLEDIKELA